MWYFLIVLAFEGRLFTSTWSGLEEKSCCLRGLLITNMFIVLAKEKKDKL